jgi:hypothetical protein
MAQPKVSVPALLSVAIIYGIVVSQPVFREVGGVSSFEIDVRSQSVAGATVSVSVVKTGDLPVVLPDDVVLVIGTARRRFFRAGGVTVSRTEIDATEIIVNPDVRRRKRAYASVAGTLSAA